MATSITNKNAPEQVLPVVSDKVGHGISRRSNAKATFTHNGKSLTGHAWIDVDAHGEWVIYDLWIAHPKTDVATDASRTVRHKAARAVWDAWHRAEAAIAAREPNA